MLYSNHHNILCYHLTMNGFWQRSFDNTVLAIVFTVQEFQISFFPLFAMMSVWLVQPFLMNDYELDSLKSHNASLLWQYFAGFSTALVLNYSFTGISTNCISISYVRKVRPRLDASEYLAHRVSCVHSSDSAVSSNTYPKAFFAAIQMK